MIKVFNSFSKSNFTKNEILNSTLDYLEKFCKNSFLDKNLQLEVTNKSFIEKNPIYYTYYPQLFKEFFSEIDHKSLLEISLASFLYYKSIINTDEIFDNKNSKNTFNLFLLVNTYQEESIKILSHFFKPNHSFWQSWNQRKKEYIKAYKIDQSSTSLKKEEFELLADYKSAFGKIGIDILYHLSGDKNDIKYNDLLESHKLFYCAFQIVDDITDLKEDYNNQYNICIQKLKEQLKKDNDNIENYSTDDLQKLAYLKNINTTLLEQAISYLNKAKEIVLKHDIEQKSQWLFEIQLLHNQIIKNYLNTKGYLTVFNTVHCQEKVTKLDTRIAIEKGNSFLSNSTYEDLFTINGICQNMTKFFIHYQQENQNSKINTLLGENEYIITDCLTTSIGLLSSEKVSEQLLNEILKFQKENGGFSKYENNSAIQHLLNSFDINSKGWENAHFDVSCIVYNLFEKHHIINEELDNYIISELKSSKNKLSYWFCNDYFALFHLINSKKEEIKVLAKQRLLSLKKSSSNIFDKAFLLKSLILLNEDEKLIRGLKQEILSKQFTDGSFEESLFYQIPTPSVTELNNVVFTESNKSFNTIVKDFNRNFTTSAAISALKLYERKFSS